MKRNFFLILTALASLCFAIFCNQQPSYGERREFSFVLVSDIHVPSQGFPINQSLDEATLMKLHNQKRLQQFVLECMTLEPKPAFVMNCGDTGDVGWTSFLKLYQKLMCTLVDAGIPVYTVVGNHELDYTGIVAQDLAEIFDPLGPLLIGRHGTRYSFNHEGCHFVVMNIRPVTGLIRLKPEDFSWLRTDLEEVDRNTPVLLFIHANMEDDDTHRIVEMLQPFTYPVIFQGHNHTSAMERWGGIPVVVANSLYEGKPEAGSYCVVHVTQDSITIRTRDFAYSSLILGQSDFVEFPTPGPELHIVEPVAETIDGDSVKLAVETKPFASGVVDYRFLGSGDWTPMALFNGKWKVSASLPKESGHHFLSFRFRGENGSVVLAHTSFTVPDERVHEIWSKDLGSAIMGSPAMWRDLVIVPAIEGGVYALRTKDGDLVWHRNNDNGQHLGRIVIAGDVVYYGAGRTVYACNAADGKEIWKSNVEGSVLAGITAGNGRLFVPSGEHKLYCLDTKRGTILWEYDVPLPIIMNTVTDGKKVFFGAMDGFLRAVDASSGKEIWRQRVNSPQDNYTTASFWPPVIASDRVIIGKIPSTADENNVTAYMATDGAKAWSRRLIGGTYRFAVDPAQTRVFLYARQNKSSGVQCLSVIDGSLLWNQNESPTMNAGISDGNTLIVRDGLFTGCINIEQGNLIWKYKTSTGPQGSYYGPHAMAFKGNQAIIGTMDGIVMALKW